mmetsp:Transcript_14914/g.31375  ORF Transcript_14914/g.31375 Transcript_14914/m.31375 type:complete len:1014 (+) Transcript_14914:55-3096(+)
MNMSEFDNDDYDDELANFDLDAALKTSCTPCKRSFFQTNDHTPTSGSSHNASSSTTYDGGSPGIDLPAISKQDEQTAHLASELDNVPESFRKAVTQTLQKHFGYSSFRPGQLTILYSIIGDRVNPPRDTCIFMATGAGKSLSFTLPPLHLNQVAIVISPLVSLMQDQCSKLNGQAGHNVATYLGPSQPDCQAEEKALRGEYRVVFLTPEKLVGGGDSFLNRLARMHQFGGDGRICLMAVDESHCVSEWGHDFRKEYLDIGVKIRSHSVLSAIPLIALTATALPRVQEDIRKNLRISSNATNVNSSFDRPNLKISINRKPNGGHASVFQPLVKDLAETIAQYNFKTKGVPVRSTIVYASTKKDVESVSDSIISNLAYHLVHCGGQNNDMTLEAARQIASNYVRPYHAGLSHAERTLAHESFLIGQTAIIVATIAFGMGIDKPDIRRVIHWGGCKSVESYYQQIGRAGRDGLNSECIMYCNENDFTKYQSDFYLGNLSGEARTLAIRSLEALKSFAMSTEGCRRALLLNFFEETPRFGNFCGSCDLCLGKKNNPDDIERDFQYEGARILLIVIGAVNGQPISIIEKVISGGKVEDYRFNSAIASKKDFIMKAIIVLKSKMKKNRPVSYIKEFLPALEERKYVRQETKKNSHKYSKAYSVYYLTSKGMKAAGSGPIVLPVPPSIRIQEQMEEEKRKKTISALEVAGVDLNLISSEELETGEGETFKAYEKWFSYIGSMHKNGNTEKVKRLDDLKSRIERWRLDTAEAYRMAPGSVLEEHLLLKVAYTTACLPSGCAMEKEALQAAGVRSNGVDELIIVLREWSKQTDSKILATPDIICHDLTMYLKPGEVFKPEKPWRFAVYRPNKKTGLAAWETSYRRFHNGEHIQTIAMTQSSGKPIQVQTVCSHILESLTHGNGVNLHRLSSMKSAPSKNEWDQLSHCEAVTGFDAAGDPTTSGANCGLFRMADFLVPIMGNQFALKGYQDRTFEEKEKFGKWCNLLQWYLALRRIGYMPTFE